MTHLLQVRIEDEQWQQIQDAATADRRSVASWVRLLIEDRLNDMLYREEWWDWYHKEESKKASVAQAEPSAPTREDAGSRPARRAGKGLPATQGSSERSVDPQHQIQDAPYRTESPSRPTKKGKACKHTNQIRKLGAAFCLDCGEFV